MTHDATEIGIDLGLAALPFEFEALARATSHDVDGREVRIPIADDFIVMKAVAGRPQDLLDIAEALNSHPDVDLRRVRRWVRQFAQVLENDAIVAQFERVVKEWRGHRRRDARHLNAP